MTILGTITLWLMLLLALWGLVVGRIEGLQYSASRAAAIQKPLLAVATLCLVMGFVRQDLNVAYVARHATHTLDAAFIPAAVAAGWSGFALLSLMVCSFATPLMPAPRQARVISLIVLVGAGLLIWPGRLFSRLGITPFEGEGLDPSLTGVLPMIALLLFAVAAGVVAAAMVRRASIGWRLTAAGWTLLTVGLMLGSWHAYRFGDAAGRFLWSSRLNAAAYAWGTLALLLLARAWARRGRPALRMAPVMLMVVGGGLLVAGALAARRPSGREFRLKPGASAEVRSSFGATYRLMHMGVSRFQSPDHVTAAATLDADRNEKSIGLLTAERRQYFDMLGRPLGAPLVRFGIHRGLLEDVQVVFRESTRQEEALYEVAVRPLVSLVWTGFVLLLVAGILFTVRERP